MELTDLLADHGAASWDKQMALADAIGEDAWQLSVSQGRITFGGRRSFPVQLLGSEAGTAGDGGTWLWSWANADSNLPPALVRAAEQMRDFGARNDVPAFVTPSFDLEVADGHLLSLTASGLGRADAYYRGPYDGGAVFVLLDAPALRERADDTPLRFIRIFTEFILAFSCDHRRALAAYVAYKGGRLEAQGAADLITLPGGQLRAEFDALGRLAKFESLLTADNSRPAPKKPWWKPGG